jgi:hypothetical protein
VNGKTILVCALLSLVNSTGLLAIYHAWNGGQSRQKIATLDIAEIYRLKESQFSAILTKPGASEAERAQAIEQARAFGAELASLTQSLPRECGCLVLTKGAIVGGGANIPDLTSQVKRRFGM